MLILSMATQSQYNLCITMLGIYMSLGTWVMLTHLYTAVDVMVLVMILPEYNALAVTLISGLLACIKELLIVPVVQ